MAAAAVLLSSIPAVLALARLIIRTHAVMKLVEKEIPDTAAVMRLSGMEVTDMVSELGSLGNDLSSGVRSTASMATMVEQGIKKGVIAVPHVLSRAENAARVLLGGAGAESNFRHSTSATRGMKHEAPVALPPAEDVEHGEDAYDLKAMTTPVLSGIAFQAFVKIFETSAGSWIYPRLDKQSGMHRVMKGITLPEAPTFTPCIPHPTDWEERSCKRIQSKDAAGAVAEGWEGGAFPGIPHDWHEHTSKLHVAAGSSPSVYCPPSIADYYSAYRSGATTPTDVAARIIKYLGNDAEANPSKGRPHPLAWFIAWDADDIQRQARESTARIQAGHPLSVLEGVPFAVKDMMDALPYGTTCGTSFLSDV
eukprot:gene11910-15009_t